MHLFMHGAALLATGIFSDSVHVNRFIIASECCSTFADYMRPVDWQEFLNIPMALIPS